jgi:hypothetical protein
MECEGIMLRLTDMNVSIDTIVQLFRFEASAVIGTSQPIYRMCDNGRRVRRLSIAQNEQGAKFVIASGSSTHEPCAALEGQRSLRHLLIDWRIGGYMLG